MTPGERISVRLIAYESGHVHIFDHAPPPTYNQTTQLRVLDLTTVVTGDIVETAPGSIAIILDPESIQHLRNIPTTCGGNRCPICTPHDNAD